MANHRGREWEWKGNPYKAEPGQFVTSIPSIAEKSGKGISKQNVRTALKRFERYGFLTDESTNKNRLITIVNWRKYQGYDDDNNTQTNRQLTGNQQATNRQLTPNKNVRMKECKNERNNTTTTNNARDAIAFYQNNFGMATPYVAEDILYWINDVGDEMVIEAMTRSLERNKTNWGYVKSILRSWHNKGIKTIEQARAEQVEFENQRQQRYQSNNKRSHEVIPDWFNDRKQNKHQSDKVTHIEDVDIEKEKQEMMDFIKKASGS